MSEFEFTDRYQALGIPYPNRETMCLNQCEGTGFVPVNKDDKNDDEGSWHDLWVEAEAKNPTEDGYHFVRCPACRGTGKRTK
jgi:hypothetical protein